MAKSKVRYGTKIRKRVKAIEVLQRARHECPTCGKKKVRRKSTSLWECGGCGAVFAGGAYSPRTSVGETTRRIMKGMRTAIPAQEKPTATEDNRQQRKSFLDRYKTEAVEQ